MSFFSQIIWPFQNKVVPLHCQKEVKPTIKKQVRIMAKIIDIYAASRENMEVLKEYLKNSETHKLCFLEEHDMPYAVAGELEEVAIAKVEYINGSVEFTCVKVEEEIPDFESEEELEEWLEEMAEDYDAWIYEESDFCYNTCALAVYEILSNLPIE